MKILNIIIIFLVVGLLFAGLGFWYFTTLLNPPDSASKAKEVNFEITSGQGVKEIGANLEKAGVIRSASAFEWYVWLEGVTAKIQAGTYQLNTSQKMATILDIITAGQALSRETEFQVLEGWSLEKIASYYGEKFSSDRNKDEATLAQEFIQAADTTDSRNIIPGDTFGFLVDKPKTAGLEGYLFPDTYRVYKDATPAQIIQKMLDNFDQKLDSEIRQKISAGGHTIFEIVTMASIVEKEARTDQDRKMVADIFWRRIQNGMPLQSDATVNYVTGKSELQPSIDDTKVDSPYNTYLYKGLPPGPICNPSLDSINAAVNPEPNDYVYYLNAPDGQTIFSKTFEEHKLNKAKYLN
ncbi:MAG: endolytic transglycosylase MltG [Patescibacteria group bacterium]|nr:endolytic transglycosylase MltG [Patescibacteria group bacterium]MDD5567365.1 endolytic transglycosylase MltG [Patescibacteria group bacterium]